MKHENKLGMFIHWGPYALIEEHEQAMAKCSIPKEVYEKMAMGFDPDEYDPDKWVALAKGAGMKYICFTAKHHDGFCMWDTKYTSYSIMATHGHDVLKELSDACHRQGMLLSIYYSNPDWHHPKAYNPNSTHQWCATKEESDLVEYREYIKGQITELLTNYGKIYTLFWDIPPKLYDPTLNELARRLQPEMLINDRGWSEGDFSTPERDFNEVGFKRFERMTEACNSVGAESWGYRRDEDFHTKRYLTQSIDKIMAMGGSYLINVGPDKHGIITEEYASRIRAIGEWYKKVRHSLEGCEEDPYGLKVRGARCITTYKNGKSYLHFYEGLLSSGINIEGYPKEPAEVKLLNTGTTLRTLIGLVPSLYNLDGTSRTALRICGICADELECEAPVIEIRW